MNIRNLFLVLTCINLTSIGCLGQNEISGKYILKNGSDRNYILLNADNSFKFAYLRDIQWDFACGQYQRKGDSILFHYTSDMFNLQCNNEGINYSDTSGAFTETIDKRFRPITALLLKRRIMTIKTGDIQEPETLELWRTYYVKRKEKKTLSGSPDSSQMAYQTDLK